MKEGGQLNYMLSNDLDYTLSSLDERKEKVNNIIDYYDEELVNYYENYHKIAIGKQQKTSEFDSMAKDLEKVADYLLYSENKEKKKTEEKDKVLNLRQQSNRKKKEVLTHNFSYVDNTQREIQKNMKLYPKIKVFEQDRKEFNELRETGNLIKNLKKQIQSKSDSCGNQLSNEQVKKLRWIVIDVGRDEVVMKEQLKGYFNFKSVEPTPPFYDMTLFNFTEPNQVKSLLDNYIELKENTFEDTNSDIKVLLFVLEDLVDKAIQEPILNEILMLRFDGFNHDRIRQEIKDKFNIEITRRRISQILKEVIPKLICQEYRKKYFEFIHNLKKDGKYKKCQNCNNFYLPTTDYFHADKYKEDGLYPICKTCRKKS